MKKVLVIALFGVIPVLTAALAEAQDVFPAAPALAATAQPAPRPAPAAPAAPAPRPAQAAPAAPPAAPAQAAPPAPPTPPLQPISLRPAANVRFDVTITDTGGAKPVVKTLSLTVSSTNSNGSVRTTAKMPGIGIDSNSPFPLQAGPGGGSMMAVPLNVDVRNVTWVDANAIRATISVEYQPYIPDAKSQPGVISASAQSLFYDGRRTQILVASDPVSDRKTTIEVTATILK